MIAARHLSLGVWLLVMLVDAAPVVNRWDVADCNVKARDSVPAARAPGNVGAAAPRGDPSPAGQPIGPLSSPGDTTMSPGDTATDVEGLASHRANDEAYVVAYRLCMRQRGF